MFGGVVCVDWLFWFKVLFVGWCCVCGMVVVE